MTFERTFDYELIRTIITNPAIYDHVSDDGSPSREEYKPIEADCVWYVLVKEGEEVLGCFIFVPQNSVTYEIHTCLLPNAWGDWAHDASLKIRDWMFTNSHAERVVTSVPENNRLALRFARSAGMVEYGMNPKSYMKHGVLYGQILLGVSKCQ